MIARFQRVVPRWSLPLVAVVVGVAGLMVALFLAVFVMTNGGTEGERGGAGGPPSELAAVSDSLPTYPGALLDEADVSTGAEIGTFFWVKDEPELVMRFYESELMSQGWKAETEATRVVSEKDGGPATGGYTRSFVRDDVRVTITALENVKDPALGKTHLHVLVTFR